MEVLGLCAAKAFLDLAAPWKGRGGGGELPGEEAVRRDRAMRPATPASTPAHPHPDRVGGAPLSASWVRSTPSARASPWASRSGRTCQSSARSSGLRSCAWGRRSPCASGRSSPWDSSCPWSGPPSACCPQMKLSLRMGLKLKTRLFAATVEAQLKAQTELPDCAPVTRDDPAAVERRPHTHAAFAIC